MKKGFTLLVLLIGAARASAQLVVNRVNVNQLDIQYCQLICEYTSLSHKVNAYIDYGQARFGEGVIGQLWQIDANGKDTRRFDTVVQAVNFVEKKGWEVVSFQVTQSSGGSVSEYIYLMRKRKEQ